MSKHFISVLGTSLYQPVIYEDSVYQSEAELEFVQFAVIDKYREYFDDENALITILVTSKSKEQNFEDREYNSNDISCQGRWKPTPAMINKVGEMKKGFKSKFDEFFPNMKAKFECIEIDDAITAEGNETNFQIIYSCIRENDEIYFDVTHGFRTIPMLALSVVNYAKMLKNCTVCDITYGAFEGPAIIEGDGKRHTQLVSLCLYSELLNWADAANAFAKFGNASLVKQVFNEKYNSIVQENKSNWKGTKKIIESADKLSIAIQTCRGVDGEFINCKGKNKPCISIKSAYSSFANSVKDANEELNTNIKPLIPLFDTVKQRLSIFDENENYKIGLAVVKWSIENNMIQQGYTALEESIKTFLCYYYQLDQLDKINREDIIGRCTNFIAHEIMNNTELINDSRLELVNLWLDNGNEGWCIPYNEAQKEICIKIISTIPFQMITIINAVKEKRNDINHFGMRKSPSGAALFAVSLKENYEKICSLIDDMLAIE